ncbi:helix-turn-helix domain-containing protein [Roseibium alexandrii]|uniref:AraC-type DNA-binding domain-containing protein n=1 Tax=Roseibium alexandrii (strain DSM 17067 / NCIMB 14079 / DFL-11) TaxID=244592 RepID=A0A5E8H1G7_ROSAD|nr:helix-turn-helix domain-containing protein [Roseibium alexandrii]EEE45814.2 AraC-type DNA-binding domain-containing protein [Roseibium alexandrii DFL-11]
MTGRENASTNRGLTSQWIEDQRLVQHSAKMPILHERVVQLEPGKDALKYILATGRESVIIRISTLPLVTAERLTSPDWITIIYPLSWAREYLLNGHECETGHLYLFQGPNGFISSARQRDSITIGLRRQRLIATCASLLGVDTEDIALDDAVVKLPAAIDQFFRQSLCKVLSTPDYTTRQYGQVTMPAALEADLYAMIAGVLAPCVFPELKGRMGQRSSLKSLRCVSEFIDLNGCANLSTADLCRVAKLEYSRLHAVFDEVLGTSPYKYLQSARLSEARRLLLDDRNPPKSIKDVALSLGYMKSGRFAEQYRDMFDELPSETMARANQTR